MFTLLKGERRLVYAKIDLPKGMETFTIETATYEVPDVQDGSCEIDNVDKIVSFYADTTLDEYKKDRKYLAEFTITVEDSTKIIKRRVVLNIV